MLMSWTNSPNPVWSFISKTDPTQGISISAANGDKCGAQQQPRQITMNFPCAPSGPVHPSSWSVATSGTNPCAYTVTYTTSASCEGTKPTSPPTSGPSGPGGSTPSSGGISGGSVFIILFLVFIVLYIGIGFGYNMKVKGLSGVEAFPNIEFWKEFGRYVTAGCVFTRHGCKKGSGEYETIDK